MSKQTNEKKNRFELCITVDFYDDLTSSYFTKKTFKEMMRLFREWGVKRVYFIDEFRKKEYGFFDWMPNEEVRKNTNIT